MKKYLKEASKPVLSDVDMSEMNDTSDSDIDPPKKGKPSIKAKQSTSIVLTSSESEKSETTSKQKIIKTRLWRSDVFERLLVEIYTPTRTYDL
jgi:hypothetical protein